MKAKINCAHCQSEFSAKTHNNRFCTKKCQRLYRNLNKRETSSKICKYCDSSFIDTSRFNLGEYCSKDCWEWSRVARRYDISNAEHRLLNKKDRCEICQNTFKNKMDKCVDHCHDTGIVRGVLCQKCNMSLGHFGDNIDGIIKVINYLKRELILDETGETLC